MRVNKQNKHHSRGSQSSPLTAAETDSILQSLVKFIRYIESIRTVSNVVCQHTMSIINKMIDSIFEVISYFCWC